MYFKTKSKTFEKVSNVLRILAVDFSLTYPAEKTFFTAPVLAVINVKKKFFLVMFIFNAHLLFPTTLRNTEGWYAYIYGNLRTHLLSIFEVKVNFLINWRNESSTLDSTTPLVYNLLNFFKLNFKLRKAIFDLIGLELKFFLC
jgi:hypothetical protein